MKSFIMPTFREEPWEQDRRAAERRAREEQIRRETGRFPTYRDSAHKRRASSAGNIKLKKQRTGFRKQQSFNFNHSTRAQKAIPFLILALFALSLWLHHQPGLLASSNNTLLSSPGISVVGPNTYVIPRNTKPTTSLPSNVIAVPGPWQYRWVKVVNPPPGTPKYVRQKYRVVHYESVTP